MIEELARWFVALLGTYVAAGAVVAVGLHARGLVLIDPVTRGSGFAFRAVITPGLVALWPLMLVRWRRAARGESAAGDADRPVSSSGLRARHRRLAWVMGLSVPFIAGLGLAMRPAPPALDTAAREALPNTEALPEVIEEWPAPWPALPLAVTLRGANGSERQIEVAVARDLERPSVVLFFEPEGADERARVFLGSLPGPGAWRYALPANGGPGGTLVLHSLGHGETLGRLDLPESR